MTMLSVNRPCGLTSARTGAEMQANPVNTQVTKNVFRCIAGLLGVIFSQAVLTEYRLDRRPQERIRFSTRSSAVRAVRSRSYEAIHAQGIVVEKPALFVFFTLADDALQCLDPLLVGRRERAHRPVAAEHDAVRPKNLQHVVDDRRQVVCAPGSRLGRGDNAG